MKKNNKVDLPGLQPNSKSHRFGECFCIVSPPTEICGYHMSISHPNRYPTWDEIRDAWYSLIPGASKRFAAMILPSRKEYVNVHENCFHVHEINKSDYMRQS